MPKFRTSTNQLKGRGKEDDDESGGESKLANSLLRDGILLPRSVCLTSDNTGNAHVIWPELQ